MGAFVYLQILAACEHFSAARKQTRKWLLASVDADVVDELVLGFERSQLAAAVAPQADVVGLLAAARPGADVLDADVRHQLVHRGERPTTHEGRQRRERRLHVRRVHPLAEQLLLQSGAERRRRRRRRPKVREEPGAGAVVVECPSRAVCHARRSQTAARHRTVVDRSQLSELPLRVDLLPLTLVVGQDAVCRRLKRIRRCHYRDVTRRWMVLVDDSLGIDFR